ncbi:MAG: GNAT family N-acetyltransferase [Chloroflexota bacterium]|nr:GNAT family N-acetyltransferase [Chloroflexota bacterium]
MAAGPPGTDLRRYETAVILRDGSTLYLRPIKPDDEERLISFFYRLSLDTVYLRFHRILTQLSVEEARRLCNVDYDSSFALVGILGESAEERIIAVGRYNRLATGDSAEVAFVVEDPYQGRGIGTHLLEQLAVVAREKGIRLFEAEVLGQNREMMRVFLDSGFRVERELEYGVHKVVLNVAPTPAVEERSAERERIATIASLRAFLNPRSIAVIGASQKRTGIGNIIFSNLLRYSFNGVVYPVNPKADVVASVKAYPSVLDITGDVHLAVVVVPAEAVLGVLEECGRKGVRGAVVISAGFGESGDEGLTMQNKLLATARSYGMRLVGPNCFGILNTSPQVNMNATFSLTYPPSGNVALSAQSGALGLAILEYAHTLGIGLSTFVSLGNRADVSSNDLLQYWQQDPATNVMLLYLESFGNPRKFARIARSVTTIKPVVALKSGRTPAGSRAAASHTGALATAEVFSDALFRQAGIIRVDTLEELFDVANLLSHQALPQGRRVAILTNGGGLGILAADACATRELEVPSLSPETVSEMRTSLPRQASTANPVDMTAEASAEDYRQCLKLLLHDEAVDIVIVIFISPVVMHPEAISKVITEAAAEFQRRGKTLVASLVGTPSASAATGTGEKGFVPCFTFPESAALALARACEYAEWLKRPKGVIPELKGVNEKRAEQVVEAAVHQRVAPPSWLDTASVIQLLDAYGIRSAPTTLATTPEEAGKAAKELGFPVAVKLLSSTISHKTDVGGVVLDLRTQKQVEHAFGRIKESLGGIGKEDEMLGVLIQKMVPHGIEVIVGVTQDPTFGPLIMFGMGGIYAELFGDTVFRIHPLTDVDAHEMVRSVRAHRLLEGWRGAKPADIMAIEELLLRISAMVEDLPQIAELDLNPVKLQERGKGYIVVDARVVLS